MQLDADISVGLQVGIRKIYRIEIELVLYNLLVIIFRPCESAKHDQSLTRDI